VRFFIDTDATNGVNLVDCGTVTGTLPAAAMSMGMQFTQTNTTSGVTADLDYARFWQDDAPVLTTSAPVVSQNEVTQADIATSSETPSIAEDPTTVSSALGSTLTDASSVTNSSSTTDTSQQTAAPDGTTQIKDSSGVVRFTIDSSGNTSLDGDLKLANADISGGLSVGGDVNVAGLSTFQKLATFLGKTIFRQDVEFNGHISVNNDTAGYAKLRSGETTVHVKFNTPFSNPPIVSASISNGQFALNSVNNVTTQGFDIGLQSPATAVTTFNWVAVGALQPQTSINTTSSVDNQPTTSTN
jgi:hypothetical protein